MTDDRMNTGVKPILKSLTAAEEGKEWRLIRFVAAEIGWFLLLFVCAVYFISPETNTRNSWFIGWLLGCLAFLVALEVLSRIKGEFYETSLFRIIRIQVAVFLGSALLWMTGGAESYFWFIYLWPLVASALYFPWIVTWGIYSEVAALYSIASLAAVADLALGKPAALIANLAILLVLTVVFRYLVETIRKLQVTERKLRYSEILQKMQEDIDAAIGLQQVLDTILRRAVELVGARDGSLMLIDEEDKLRFRARVGGLFPKGKEERCFMLGEGIAGQVAQNCKPYVSHDTRVDTNFVSIIGGEPILSLVSVPIISHSTVLGVINVDSAKPNQFSAADAELLMTLANQTAVAIERAELLDSLREIGEKTLGGAEDLYQYAVEAVHRLTRCPVAMWRVDETGKQARIVASRRVSTEYAQKARLDLDRSVTGRAIRERETIQVLDIQADPDFQKEEEAAREGWQSMLVVPLLAGPERAVGTLSIYSLTKREEFTRWELDLLRAFAGQAGVAIQNARLHADLKRQIERLQTLNQVSRDLSAELDIRAIFEIAVEAVVQTLDCTHCTIFVLEDDLLVPRASHSKDEETKVTRCFTLGEGLAGWVAQHGESVLTCDAKKDERFSKGETRPDVDRSMSVVPVRVNGQVVGVISADQDRVNAFDKRDLQIVETLALQAGTALEKAQSYEHSRQQLDSLRKIVGAIGAKTDPLPVIVEEAVKLFDAEYGSLSLVDSVARRLICQARWEEGKIQVGKDIPEDKRGRNWDEGGITVHVVRTGEAYRTGNAAADSLYRESHKSTVSELAVPLKDMDGKTIGVLNLESPMPDAFSQTEEELCQELAMVAATAIEKDRLFDAEQRLNTQLEILHQVVQERSVKEVLDRTLEGINAILGEEASSSIARYSERTDSFYEYRASGPLRDYLLQVPPRPIGTGRHIIDTKEPLYLDDVHNPPPGCPAIRKESIEKGVRSFAALPLKWQEQMVGALFVNVQRSISFTNELQRILQLFANQAAIAIENARLYKSLERRIRELEVLTEIGRTVSNLGIDEILDLVYEQAGKIMDLSDAQVQIAFYDEAKDEVVFPLAIEQDNGQIIDVVRWSRREAEYRKPDEDEVVNQFRPRPRGTRFGLTEYVINTKQPVLILEDFEQQAKDRGIQVWPTFGRLDRPTHSWLGVPMIVQDRVIGIISIQSLEVEHAFDQGHVELLTTVASQAAVAIENARLLVRETRRAQQLTGLQEIGVRITSQLDLEEVLDSIVENVNRIVPADFSTLFLYNLEEDRFEKGVRKGNIGIEPTIPSNTGFAARIAKTREAVFAEDAEKQPGVKPTFIEAKKVKSFAGVPLLFGGRTVGVLYVNFFEHHGFSEEERQIIHLLASQAAVAIENARLYAEMEKRVEERTRAWQEAQNQVLEEEQKRQEAERWAYLGRLAGSLAHRIGNKGGIIRLCIQDIRRWMVSTGTKDDWIEEQLDTIAGNNQYLLGLSDYLLKPRGAMQKGLQNTDVCYFLEDALRYADIPSDVEVVREYPDHLPPVAGNKYLVDVFLELIDNSVEAMEVSPAKRLTVGAKQEGGWIKVQFSDTGPGILTGREETIFEFFAPSSDKKLSEEGHRGFGLWWVKTFLKEIGGDIEYKSSPGIGTTFYVRLPVVEDDHEE